MLFRSSHLAERRGVHVTLAQNVAIKRVSFEDDEKDEHIDVSMLKQLYTLRDGAKCLLNELPNCIKVQVLASSRTTACASRSVRAARR